MTNGFPDTVYGNVTTQTRLQSETADSITWARYACPTSSLVEHGHGRVTFEELDSLTPLHAALHRVRLLHHQHRQQRPQHHPVMVVVGRSRCLAVESHHAELRTLETVHGVVRGDVRKTVGDVGTAFVMAGLDSNLIVMQASGTHSD
jgi:Mg-chelatase subunit ChlD